MKNLREDLWSAWHLKENRSHVLLRLEQITRHEERRISAAERVLNFKDAISHEQHGKMLRHWSEQLNDCTYELCGIANGLIGKKMP